MNSLSFWLLINILSLIALSFYSMLEMACVSFDRVRLQYEVAKGRRKAIWLNELLHHPSLLFGTTLIGVNAALVVGSESARELFLALNINPAWAPVYEILLLVILGELTPMFAARRYPEHVAMLGISIIYATSRLFSPFLWVLEKVVQTVSHWLGGRQWESPLALGREDLQRLLEEQDEPRWDHKSSDEWNQTISNIFSIGEKRVLEVMHPLSEIHALSPNCTVTQLQEALEKWPQTFFPIMQEKRRHVQGVVFPKDLIRAPSTRRVRDYARQPTFVDLQMKLIDLLKHLRKSGEEIAFVIDVKAAVIGFITLDHVMSAIFGFLDKSRTNGFSWDKKVVVQRTFSASVTIDQLAKKENIHLPADDVEMTLIDLFIERLGHQPEEGETIFLGPYELSVKEASLLEVKTISIATRSI